MTMEKTSKIMEIAEKEYPGKGWMIGTSNKNGVLKEYISCTFSGTNISPLLYIEIFPDDCETNAVKSILADVMERSSEISSERHKIEKIKNLLISDYKTLLPHLSIKALETKKNAEILKNVLHKDILNVSLVPILVMDVDAGSMTTMIPITVLYRSQGIPNIDQMLKDIWNNENPYNTSTFQSMMDIIRSACFCEEEHQEEDPVRILTNEKQQFGIHLLFNPKISDWIYQKVGDYIVLPSSVHEGLILPLGTLKNNLSGDRAESSLEESLDELLFTVKTVNADTSIMDPVEVLSDCVYYYKDGELQVYTGREKEEG